ncbi:MAG: hypothetical protein CMK96_06295 [Pseudomonas sp.]|nr:hypothetical protein [Pseudomonas sp.]QDP67280.1 MAG: hypothetical protein GOVbin7368_71 [Prokaryotic dsDNA virus sp.]|tara:strand:+ start:1242 stop:1490 length:249 start_codon:yes stop_codon:yes gene_type:complete
MDGSQISTTGAELRQFIERIEAVRAEIAESKAVEKEIFAEMKARGFMTRPVRSVLKIRATDPNQRAEEEAVTQMYLDALGMA